jgi:hypothetical protein
MAPVTALGTPAKGNKTPALEPGGAQQWMCVAVAGPPTRSLQLSFTVIIVCAVFRISERARRSFLRSIQSRDEDTVGTHRFGEQQSAKNKYANKNTSHQSPPRAGRYPPPDLMNVK